MRRFILFILFTTLARAAAPEWNAALELVREKRYPEARPLLEKVVASEPSNADAWHQLGIVWQARRDDAASAKALQCYKKAVELAPLNPGFLFDYGVTSLDHASRARSLSAASAGREALEKVISLDPSNLDAREALFQYFTRAPFFAGGSASKAAAQLEEIRKRDTDRATALAVLSKTSAKDFTAAFSLCEEALARNPSHYTALYLYGRTAGVSGTRLERGLACLQKALTITPPGPVSPTHSHVWFRIGVLQEKLGAREEARGAYEAALRIDPTNLQAETALKRMRG